MSDNIKTWMIEPGDVLDVVPPVEKPLATATIKRPPRPEPGRSPEPPRPEPLRRRAKPTPRARPRLQFAPLAALTYLLGPLAVLLTPERRSDRNLMIMSGLAVMTLPPLLLAGFNGLVRPDRASTAWVWLALLLIAGGAGFTCWARAVHLLGREGLPPVNRLPYWLRRRWSVGLLGLIAPGSGLLLSGHPGRAALTLWSLGPTVVAALVVVNGLGLWRHHLQSGWLANSGRGLEIALVLAAATVAVGFLVYIAQALEGARRIIAEPGLQKSVRGDYYAVAVLALVAVLVVSVSPVRLASQIDTGGDVLQAEGFQFIPLQISLAAHHLNPGEPEYALQAADLYAALGQPAQAAAIRSDLDRSLSSYVAFLRQDRATDLELAHAAGATQNGNRQTLTKSAANAVPPAGATVGQQLDPTQLVGAMVRGSRPEPAATPEAEPDPRPATASQTMGLPPGLPDAIDEPRSGSGPDR